MVTYSYIPPEYKTPKPKPKPKPTPHSSQPLKPPSPHTPHIPYRNTGAAGKRIFGQPPSWTRKPLPPFPFEKAGMPISSSSSSPSSESPRTSKFREDDCGSVETQGDGTEALLESTGPDGGAREGRVRRVVKGFSRRVGRGVLG